MEFDYSGKGWRIQSNYKQSPEGLLDIFVVLKKSPDLLKNMFYSYS